MDLVDSVANRVLAMNEGTIIQDADTNDIFTDEILHQCNLEPPVRMKMLQTLQSF